MILNFHADSSIMCLNRNQDCFVVDCVRNGVIDQIVQHTAQLCFVS